MHTFISAILSTWLLCFSNFYFYCWINKFCIFTYWERKREREREFVRETDFLRFDNFAFLYFRYLIICKCAWVVFFISFFLNPYHNFFHFSLTFFFCLLSDEILISSYVSNLFSQMYLLLFHFFFIKSRICAFSFHLFPGFIYERHFIVCWYIHRIEYYQSSCTHMRAWFILLKF